MLEEGSRPYAAATLFKVSPPSEKVEDPISMALDQVYAIWYIKHLTGRWTRFTCRPSYELCPIHSVEAIAPKCGLILAGVWPFAGIGKKKLSAAVLNVLTERGTR